MPRSCFFFPTDVESQIKRENITVPVIDILQINSLETVRCGLEDLGATGYVSVKYNLLTRQLLREIIKCYSTRKNTKKSNTFLAAGQKFI